MKPPVRRMSKNDEEPSRRYSRRQLGSKRGKYKPRKGGNSSEVNNLADLNGGEVKFRPIDTPIIKHLSLA